MTRITQRCGRDAHGRFNAPVGDDPRRRSSDEDFSSGGTAVRIASVAALGGLLFGYDSAVINGAVDSIQEDFGIGNDRARVRRRLGAARRRGRRDDGGTDRRQDRPHLGDEDRRGALPHQRVRHRLRARGRGPSCCSGSSAASVSASRRSSRRPTSPRRRRRGIRGRLGSLQQLAIVSGIFLSFADQLAAAEDRRAAPNEELWLGLDAWRWMFLVMAVPAVVYGAAGVHHSRVAALSRCQPQDSGSPQGAHHAARREEPRDHDQPHPGRPWSARTSRPGAI